MPEDGKLGALIATGRTAEVYTWGEGQVLKLGYDWVGRETLESEARLTQAAHEAGLPAPAVGEVVEVKGRCGLVFGRVEGASMLDVLQKRPWQMRRYAVMLAELHAQMHERQAPEMPRQRERLRWKIEHARPLKEALRQAALEALEQMTDELCICHGDFHPGNVLLTAKGPVIIDWNDATAGHPLADVSRSVILLAKGALPMGPPVSWLLQAIRQRLTEAYLERYLTLRGGRRQQIEQWMPVVAAARLSEGIGREEKTLLRMAESLSKGKLGSCE